MSSRFDLTTNVDKIERIDGRKVTKEQFIERYEKPRKPVIITNVIDKWRANDKWTLEVVGICIYLT